MIQCQHCKSIDRKVYLIDVIIRNKQDKVLIKMHLCDECIQDTEHKLKYYINDENRMKYKYKNMKIQ